MDAALITVMQIHLTEPEGDILLFLTGAPLALQCEAHQVKNILLAHAVRHDLQLCPGDAT